MKKIALADVGVSELLPPDLRKALMDVENWPPAQRQSRINELTDEAGRRGLARHRDDTSRLVQWQAKKAASA